MLGAIPFWAKNIKIGFSTINAKAEGIETKPAFREAFQRRRCLVPLDNFCEWVKDRCAQVTLCDRTRRPAPDGHGRPVGDLALAGERAVRSFTIITTPPNKLCAELHDWMPVVSRCGSGNRPTCPAQVPARAPYPAEGMICWPVSARVGNVRNNDLGLIEPIAAVG